MISLEKQGMSTLNSSIQCVVSFESSRQACSHGSVKTSDDVASRLQVSDLYKFDLQVSSQFANDLFEI